MRDAVGLAADVAAMATTLASLAAYARPHVYEQVRSVVPVAAYLLLFQLAVLQRGLPAEWFGMACGLVAVVLGLVLFLEGVKHGVAPLATDLGQHLPRVLPQWAVMLVAFGLGVGVTFAEPALGALTNLGKMVEVQRAPYLVYLLVDYNGHLTWAIAVGVGLAAVVGAAKVLRGWRTSSTLLGALAPALALTAAACADDHLRGLLGLAWDAGAITTGPVTVPILLALGVGMSEHASERSVYRGESILPRSSPAPGMAMEAVDGFGTIALAGLLPVLTVMGLAIALRMTTDTAEIIHRHREDNPYRGPHPTRPWWVRDPWEELAYAGRAVLPLVCGLIALQKAVVRRPLPRVAVPWGPPWGPPRASPSAAVAAAAPPTMSVLWGLGLLLGGLCLFELGLKFGLVALGYQCGVAMPGAFSHDKDVAGSPLYPYWVGLVLLVLYTLGLGAGGTLAEPALLVFVETVWKAPRCRRNFASKRGLSLVTAAGVAVGLAIGLAKLFGAPFAAILLPAYAATAALTWKAGGDGLDALVGVAWDTAGVTTGEVTTPLILALGLGMAHALHAAEGFGLLSLASLGPILSVLVAPHVNRRQRVVSKGLDEALLEGAVTLGVGVDAPS